MENSRRPPFAMGERRDFHGICETLATSNNGGHNNGKMYQTKPRRIMQSIKDEKCFFFSQSLLLDSFHLLAKTIKIGNDFI